MKLNDDQRAHHSPIHSLTHSKQKHTNTLNHENLQHDNTQQKHQLNKHTLAFALQIERTKRNEIRLQATKAAKTNKIKEQSYK